MIPSDVLMKMTTIGLSEDHARVVIEMLLSVEQATKEEAFEQINALEVTSIQKEPSAAAIRQKRYRDRLRAARTESVTSVTEGVTGVTRYVTGVTRNATECKNRDIAGIQGVTRHGPSCAGATRVSDNILNNILTGNKNKQNARVVTGVHDLAGFKAEFADLDDDRLNALIKHRRAKRGALTRYAAKLFRRDADACRISIAQAVDTCISRNWITIKPEWLRDRNSSSSTPPQTPPKITPDSERSPEWLAMAWPMRLERGRNHGEWFEAHYGPPPGQPGCRVPPELIQAGDGMGWRVARAA